MSVGGVESALSLWVTGCSCTDMDKMFSQISGMIIFLHLPIWLFYCLTELLNPVLVVKQNLMHGFENLGNKGLLLLLKRCFTKGFSVVTKLA